jgi:hypothetical protein
MNATTHWRLDLDKDNPFRDGDLFGDSGIVISSDQEGATGGQYR